MPSTTCQPPAADVYATSTVIDGLGAPGEMDTNWERPLTPAQLADVAASGLTAVHVTTGDVGKAGQLEAFASIIRGIGFWDSQIDAHPQLLARVRTADDLRSAKAARRTGLIYGLQDGVGFETDLELLMVLHQFGIRVVQPTYNRRNLLGDGCMEPADAGLSRAGHEAVARMNALGILVDLSHCGRRTAADATLASTAPVAFTHTGCAALEDHPRHRTDAELERVADGGGVVGIYVMPYLTGGRQPTAADVVAHVEHAVKVAGEDHVGIGSDGGISPTALTGEFRARFADNVRRRHAAGIAAPGETETGYLFAADLNSPRRLEILAGMLLGRGHGPERVAKILGGNFRRLFETVWNGPAAIPPAAGVL